MQLAYYSYSEPFAFALLKRSKYIVKPMIVLLMTWPYTEGNGIKMFKLRRVPRKPKFPKNVVKIAHIL